MSDARQIRDLGFHYFAEFFAAAAREVPVALVLEDIHWADEGSLDLVEYLVRSQPDLPLMVVCACRPNFLEARPDWGAGATGNLRIELQPLSDDNSRELLGEILCKVPEIPVALQDLIVSRAEGSPYYLEELIKMLIEEGVIVTGDEQWRVARERLEIVRVPATLTGILQARLDGLPPPERETLQQASVVGRVFWGTILERLRAGNDAPGARARVCAPNRSRRVSCLPFRVRTMDWPERTATPATIGLRLTMPCTPRLSRATSTPRLSWSWHWR